MGWPQLCTDWDNTVDLGWYEVLFPTYAPVFLVIPIFPPSIIYIYSTITYSTWKWTTHYQQTYSSKTFFSFIAMNSFTDRKFFTKLWNHQNQNSISSKSIGIILQYLSPQMGSVVPQWVTVEHICLSIRSPESFYGFFLWPIIARRACGCRPQVQILWGAV